MEALQYLDVTDSNINEFNFIQYVFPKGLLNNEEEDKLNATKRIEQEVDGSHLIYKTGDTKRDRILDFQKFKGDTIFWKRSLEKI